MPICRQIYYMKISQLPSSVLMIRPASFGYNGETAPSNVFQQSPDATSVADMAREEFDRMVDLLESHDIDVIAVDDTPEPLKPDAVFPNNWLSTHPDGTVVRYPMMAVNRRAERRDDVLEVLRKSFTATNEIDLTDEEAQGNYLEGTGSVVFDYPNQRAYACRSPRTNGQLFTALCARLGMRGFLFDAADENNVAIYHTNVVMAIGDKFAVVCLDAIRSEDDQETLLNSFAETGHQVVSVSFAQMRAFAGNMMEVQSRAGEPFVILSEQAFHSLLPGQIHAISRHAEMIPVPVPTIERVGGGSVRCMLAGIFLPRR